jgi:RNA processing factor Prp31
MENRNSIEDTEQDKQELIAEILKNCQTFKITSIDLDSLHNWSLEDLVDCRDEIYKCIEQKMNFVPVDHKWRSHEYIASVLNRFFNHSDRI